MVIGEKLRLFWQNLRQQQDLRERLSAMLLVAVSTIEWIRQLLADMRVPYPCDAGYWMFFGCCCELTMVLPTPMQLGIDGGMLLLHVSLLYLLASKEIKRSTVWLFGLWVILSWLPRILKIIW